MFEAVLTVCVAAGLCREALLPGHEAATRAACEAGGQTCRPVGEVLPFDEVAPGVFVHVGRIAEPDRLNRGDVANLGFVIGEAAVAVIDAGSAPWVGEAAWRAVRARSDLPVSHLIITHVHPDHTFGGAVFARAGAQVVGHAGLERAWADRAESYRQGLGPLLGPEALIGAGLPAVTVPVAGTWQVDLGGRVLVVEAWPTAHSTTDVTVHDLATGTLFAGDLVFDRHAPALDGRLGGWQEALETLRARPLERVVPGHGPATLAWPEGGAALARYLDVLERDVRAGIAAGERLGEVARRAAASERAAWVLFETYNARNATVAYSELEWE